MKISKFSPIYGNNVGDVLISKCLENALKVGRANVDIESHDLLMRNVGEYSKKAKVKKIKIRNFISWYLQNKFPFVFYLIKKVIFKKNKSIVKYNRKILGSEVVVFGGGNVLMSSMGCDYAYRISKYLSNTKDDKFKALMFCGVGPFDYEEKKLLKNIYSKSDYISVRDYNSKKYFLDLGFDVDVFPDPAFTISDLAQKKESKNKKIGVNIIANFFSGAQLIVLAEKLVGLALVRNESIVIINTAFPNDKNEAFVLREKIREIDDAIIVDVVDLEPSASFISDVYSELSCFIGCRMHSLIFALSYKIPTVGFPWDLKVESMFEQFLSSKSKANELVIDVNNMDIVSSLDCAMNLDLEKYLSSVKLQIERGVGEIFSRYDQKKQKN